MPTLYPIAAEICTKFTHVSYVEVISAITATSFAAAISPLSTGGAIIMSSYTVAKPETSTEELNKMFYTLFLLSVSNVVINVIMSALGVFNLGGLFY
jgi:ABC-type branched-subunit amino acid transport system substrate-binding protein